MSTFDTVTSVDLDNDAARIDYSRVITFLGGLPMESSELYAGELGYIAGDDNALFPGPTDAAMLSSRWASGRKQMALLHPHILVLDVLAGDRTAAVGDEMLEGCDAVLEISDDVSPIFACVADSGELSRLETMVNDFLRRDVELVVEFGDWGGDSVQFPAEATINLEGEAIHDETRTVEVDPAFDSDLFDLPDGGMFDADLAVWGEVSHQFFQGFASLGIAIDFQQLFVLPTEIAPGVFHLTGGSHHSLAVEQDNGIVIVEAPLNPERADAILAWAEATFPNKPVTHVISTHHHEDHSAGLRSFVAAGVEVVLHEEAEMFFDEIFDAPSTVSPDTLAGAPMDPVITSVPAGALVLDDTNRPITITHLANSHCTDMLLIHVDAGGGIAFESDLYNPGNGGAALSPVLAQQLLAAIQAGDTVAVIAGGHGGVAPLSELENFVNP